MSGDEKPVWSIKRGPQYFCLDDRGDVVWQPWPETPLPRAECERLLATYAESTRRTMRIVRADNPPRAEQEVSR